MARSVEDCAIMLEAMAGFDPKDATSLDMAVPNWEAALNADLKGKRIGIPREYRMDGTDTEILESWELGKNWLRDAGAEIVDVSLPHTRYALPAYYIIAPAEASSNLARYDGVRYGLRDLPSGAGLQDMYAATRAAGFGEEVKRRVLIGTYVLSAGFYDAYYTQAQKVRALVARDFEQAWAQCDAILAPTTPTASFPLGSLDKDPLTMYLNDVFAVPASPRGPSRDERSRCAECRWIAAGPPDRRQALRRAGRARRGARDPATRQLRGPTGAVVVSRVRDWWRRFDAGCRELFVWGRPVLGSPKQERELLEKARREQIERGID